VHEKGHECRFVKKATLLEIGGSHAHRLKPLIDHLGLLTLIITDLDTLDRPGGASVQPSKGAGQKTNNATLKTGLHAMACWPW
jgi:hypothetical protein